MKRVGKQQKKQRQTPECIMVQKMSSEPSGRAKKYEPLDARNFVDFRSHNVLSFENIKVAYERFYDAPMFSCDVLHSDKQVPPAIQQSRYKERKFFMQDLLIQAR